MFWYESINFYIFYINFYQGTLTPMLVTDFGSTYNDHVFCPSQYRYNTGYYVVWFSRVVCVI